MLNLYLCFVSFGANENVLLDENKTGMFRPEAKCQPKVNKRLLFWMCNVGAGGVPSVLTPPGYLL